MTDTEIVDLYWKRDENAIRVTENQYHRYLIKIAMQILGDEADAEECVNDTYLAAWNTMPPNRPDHLGSYLGKIVREKAIDRLRFAERKKRYAQEYAVSIEELSEVLEDGKTPDQALDADALAEAVREFLRKEKPLVRNLFLGRYFYFDPLKKVASYCGIKESKAKTILFRTRKKLRNYLKKEGFPV